MPFGCSPHQCSLSTSGFGSLNIDAEGKKCQDRLDPPSARGGHQRCLPSGQLGIRVGPRLDQQVDHGGATVYAGQGQGRQSVAALCSNIGARPHENLCRGEVVVVRCPVEGRHPVGLCPARIATILDKPVDRLEFSPLRSVGYRRD